MQPIANHRLYFGKILLPLAILFYFNNGQAQGSNNGKAQKILQVAIAGLAHDHVHGILNQYKKGEVIITGIAEGEKQLVQRYKKSYQLPDSLFFADLPSLLAHKKPDVVLAYTPISEHIPVVEICAP